MSWRRSMLIAVTLKEVLRQIANGKAEHIQSERYKMRQVLIPVVVGMVLGTFVAANADDKPDEKSAAAPLYLHVFTPDPDGSNETLHLITIRFHPSEEIEVISKWSFKGRIDAREDKFVADLTFSFNGGLFDGEVEMGKRYETMFVVASPAVRFCSFAITNSNAPKPFLDRPYFLIPE